MDSASIGRENGAQVLALYASHDEVDPPTIISRKGAPTYSNIPVLPTPGPTPKALEGDANVDRSLKQHRANVGKRLTGRSPIIHSNPSLEGLTDQLNLDGSGDLPWFGRSNNAHDELLSQIYAWLSEEKQKRAARRVKRKHEVPRDTRQSLSASTIHDGSVDDRPGRSYEASDCSSAALEDLEQILATHSTEMPSRKPVLAHRRSSRARKLQLHRQSSAASASESEYPDIELSTPSCDAFLDNSKTLGYHASSVIPATTDHDAWSTSASSTRTKQAWIDFKHEILRLAHTLRLKGWSRVPQEESGEISVERLSGALTNAVYVVAPPKDLAERKTPADLLSLRRMEGGSSDASPSLTPRPARPPPKLLLRIYGSQVDHLIDREAELMILRRLAKKSIGPRVLGTFTNGRFEQFFHARALTMHDLRAPETSKQIAKRMRELHEGVELLDEERDGGPFVWRNWDKWVRRVGDICSWLDCQVTANISTLTALKSGHRENQQFVCGTDWPLFRRTVDKYRIWLYQQYGGPAKIRDKLVFAHNDTQYGNILRLEPAESSPLLHPLNEHKQLIVIDFEYSNANLPGLEFANHFTEWCYNYHDASAPHRCNTSAFPTPDEQRRFLRAYVLHGPQPHSTASVNLPNRAPSASASASSAGPSTFLLDSRTPAPPAHDDEAPETEAEVSRLMHEARLWRAANSAQWVAWGIVQAKVPDMPSPGHGMQSQQEEQQRVLQADEATDPLDPEERRVVAEMADRRPDAAEEGPAAAGGSDGGEEFDYLGYARERAMFFWGDVLQLGIVGGEEVPGWVREGAKVVPF